MQKLFPPFCIGLLEILHFGGHCLKFAVLDLTVGGVAFAQRGFDENGIDSQASSRGREWFNDVTNGHRAFIVALVEMLRRQCVRANLVENLALSSP